ncbi:lysozyme [Variovorax sp. HJSM1_2]|uniref:lysozyme n=1 Tax=Variovorax sp. HJSM1_2 TaxID=3366263 RepID=UPI003BE4A542
MNTSAFGGQAVMHYFEQCRLVAYPDPGSPLARALAAAGLKWLGSVPTSMRGLSGAPWTIGWGDTGPDVVEGLAVTQEWADARFAHRLANEFEPGVRVALVSVPTQSQFDAMVCLAYNIGVDAFKTSTVVRRFNQGDLTGAADAILMWHKSKGISLLGLRRRRAAERALFLGASGEQAIAIGKRAV